MIKKILEILKTIKCKMSCCYESQCSMNNKEKLENKINDYYNEITEGSEIEETD